MAGKRPPLVSDLEMPPLGAEVEPPTLEVGAILVAQSDNVAHLDSDLTKTQVDLDPRDGGTLLMDAQSASIQHAISRSMLSTGDQPSVAIPEILARGEVDRVLKGRPDNGRRDDNLAAAVQEAAQLGSSDLPMSIEEKLELAYEPKAQHRSRSSIIRRGHVKVRQPFPLRLMMIMVLVTAALVIAAKLFLK